MATLHWVTRGNLLARVTFKQTPKCHEGAEHVNFRGKNNTCKSLPQRGRGVFERKKAGVVVISEQRRRKS